MRDSCIFYRSFYEALVGLDKEVKANVYDAIFEYSMNDVLIELSGIEKTVFTLIKPQLDANNKRFLNGKKGGKPKQSETKTEPKENQKQTKSKANNNVNDNVNDNNIDSRKLKFASTLKPFVEVYGRDLLKDFYDYWIEPNKSNTKFRQELEKTWSLERRLQTWTKNETNFKNQKNGNSKLTSTSEFNQIVDAIKSDGVRR